MTEGIIPEQTQAGSTLSVVYDTFAEHTLLKFKITSEMHEIMI